MPKNRHYTNLERTPPSMAWLIRERAKLKGMIERREKRLSELPREIVELQAKLDALDMVIELIFLAQTPWQSGSESRKHQYFKRERSCAELHSRD